MRLIALAAILAALAVPAAAKPLPPLSVSPNGHYFVTPDGKPFFWLGDTAWELIHAATPDEQAYYLKTRSRQGYTIIQTVVLGEVDGLRKPTPDGLTPFQDGDPSKPNLAYFDRVAQVVERAESDGLYVALLPTWGDKVTAMWGLGPQIFPPSDPARAEAYGRFLAGHLKCRDNIVWMLGGDRPPENDGVDYRPVWAAMAKGITTACGHDPLIAYHPSGGPQGTSYTLPNAAWLDIHGMQSGHGGGHDVPVWEMVAHDFALPKPKPTLDLEPNYEDHPYNSWPRWDAATGYFDDYDVRKQTYRSVFAGAAGVTYGHHSIWGMVGPRNDVINHARMDWVTALHRPGGRQMVFLRDLIESRPQLDRIPDDSLILEGQDSGNLHMTATRDAAGTYAFVYFPLNDRPATIDLTRLKAKTVKAWWYDPRTGFARPMGEHTGPTLKVTSPPTGPDWVLVLDDATKGYTVPGTKP
ncbi:bme25 [Asticcacaulis biprosthecium C19]|uniref:Bme25 n=1 Tax=Asticcacaulis biprosthecium C19 TaxID=715226 RepID=F4QIX1_9CAUL|nr:glycoside hydrolase family 140 protein [Asticcacaulis biprosthecium]EGF93034.1 bme25 [Asticcacaulis biprosthecium C19]